MSYTLIITEKPAAARKIADALANGKAIKEDVNKVPSYKITHGDEDIVVACAVGHLYGLAEKEKSSWKFPVFDIEWKPVSETNKGSAYTKKYFTAIRKLAKDAKKFVVATDYDVEGEVIGLNIITHLCKQKDAYRMKFSTLTKDELISAYKNKSQSIDWAQAKAGEARHFLDWFNGINYSRALTHSIKTTGSFKLMSTGRVQGPALKIIVDREKEIKAFKPDPFWQISLEGDIKGKDIEAWHQKDKFWKREEADLVMERTKGAKDATISDTQKKQFSQPPPTPFDLTSLQVEAYRALRIPPKTTLQIAQELYVSGAISYPRTSSQKLPPSLGFKNILKNLSKNEHYTQLAEQLLGKGTLKPNEGKKTDPAHPAIYPTGSRPGTHDQRELKVYDLIVKRFMATFADPARRETATISIDCNKEIFLAKGTRTIERGWHVYYQPYVNIEEQELPSVQKGDHVAVKKITCFDKETQPPKRYTPASIVKELEKRNLGTKATRSEIVDTLFRRGYVDGKSIQATELGIRTVDTLHKYAPKILDEEMTRHFEEEMEAIREKKLTPEQVLKEAKEALTGIIEDFKKKEKDIGAELAKANKETRDELSYVGRCPKCKEGDLQVRKGRYGAFIACNKYPKCKTTFSLPRTGLAKPAKKECDTCGYPMITVIKKAKRPQDLCLNPNCPSKQVEGEAGKEAREIESGKVEKECPKCKDGKMLLRSSVYGKFLGCSNFPKCKHLEKIEDGPLKEDFTKGPKQESASKAATSVKKKKSAKKKKKTAKKRKAPKKKSA